MGSFFDACYTSTGELNIGYNLAGLRTSNYWEYTCTCIYMYKRWPESVMLNHRGDFPVTASRPRYNRHVFVVYDIVTV